MPTVQWPQEMWLETNNVALSIPGTNHVVADDGISQLSRRGAPRWIIETTVFSSNEDSATTFLDAIFASNALVTIPQDRMHGFRVPSNRGWPAGSLGIQDNMILARYGRIDGVNNPETGRYVLMGDSIGKRLYKVVSHTLDSGIYEALMIPNIRPRGLSITSVRSLAVRMFQSEPTWGLVEPAGKDSFLHYGASVTWIEAPNAIA